MDPVILYFLIAVAVAFGLTMLALVDIILKDFGSTKTKILWHFVVLVPLAGALIYFVFGYRKGTRKT